MKPVWTITYAGLEQSAAAWGLTAEPRIKTRDRSPTEISFHMSGAAPEGEIPFPFKAQVVIRQNRVFNAGAWSGSGYVFTGYQTSQPGNVDGKSQGVTLIFKDVLWLLQNTAFQQLWTITGAANLWTSRCVLFMDINSWAPNVYQSVQWQINQIITFASAQCGIAIAAGTIDYSGWFLNYYHCRAMSCWDALLKCLEPIPDAKVWIDGSTNPPQLNVRTRANLAALSSPAGTGPGPITLPYKSMDATGRLHHSTRGLTPRHDLQIPQVLLQYQINSTYNGKPSFGWTQDAYPAGSNGQTPFAMVCPIDLTGVSVTTETGTLDCEPLMVTAAQTGFSNGSANDHAAKRAWWASQRGGATEKLVMVNTSANPAQAYRVRFGANTIGDATAVDSGGNPINLANYPNRIVDGTYHSWMKTAGGTQVNAIKAHITVTVAFTEYDTGGNTPSETDTNGNLTRKANAYQLHIHAHLTNAPAGTTAFSGEGVAGIAETAVANLAQNIYNSRALLDYDGTHEIIDPGIKNGAGQTQPLQQIVGHWNLLNFSGGNVAWQTANVSIAETEIDLQTNHIRIELGPSKHLQPQDWNSMLQFFRARRQYLQSSVRATGTSDASNNVDMAKNIPGENTIAGQVVDRQQVQIDYATPSDPTSTVNGQINHDANLITQALAATTPTPIAGAGAADIKTMQPREVLMCDDSGNQFYAIVHCTAGYTKP